jgi:hypothetical protein
MAGAIDAIAERDADLASVLRMALSAILYKVSRRTSDTDPTPTTKNVARGAAARLFAQRVELLCAGLVDLGRSPPAPQPVVHNADSRDLRALGIAPGTVNAVVTSPPYVGTYDYADQQRLRFDFFGIRHRDFDDNEMGARRGFEGDLEAQRAALQQWQRDFAAVLAGLAIALQPGGRLALVVGDSIAGGRAILADQDVRAAAGDRYDLTAWAWQERLKLGTFERRAFGPDLKREHILLLTRR